jgi:hypothetical protein
VDRSGNLYREENNYQLEKGAIMRTKFFLSILIMSAVAITFSFKEAKAGLPGLPGLPAPPGLPTPPGLPGSPNVNVSINGYLPAPPGVNVQIYGGRPYYVERGQRVYLEKKRHGSHYRGHGHKYGHYKGR